jgi:hypothetical protein
MEALDHGTVSRGQLRAQAGAAGVAESRLRIPGDGEEIRIGRAGNRAGLGRRGRGAGGEY